MSYEKMINDYKTHIQTVQNEHGHDYVRLENALHIVRAMQHDINVAKDMQSWLEAQVNSAGYWWIEIEWADDSGNIYAEQPTIDRINEILKNYSGYSKVTIEFKAFKPTSFH